MQNRTIERFNRVYRQAILDAYLLNYIREVRAIIEERIKVYKERGPHKNIQN